MLVSNTTLELAMRRILNECEAFPGVPLSYRQLEREWRQTGLRGTDLRDAVRMLISHGDLECVNGHAELSFRLTGRGYTHFFHPHVPFEGLATYTDDCDSLEQARRRPHLVTPPPSVYRRMDDIDTTA